MTKKEFLQALKVGLSGLPKDDVEERLSFYGEMIDDRTEDGRTEAEAVADIGAPDDIAAQIIREIPLTKIVKERIKPQRKLKAWEIALLVIGSPIWLSLTIVAVAVVIALYAVLWSLVVVAWSVFVALVAFAVVGVPMCIVLFVGGNGASGGITLAAGIVCGGLAVVMFVGCKATTKGIVVLTKKIAIRIKKLFIKKEKIQ